MGIRSLGWHALRHTYRTLLDETGASVGVQQKLMRHANVSTTMNIYDSSSLSAGAEANSRVVRMLVPKEKPSDSEHRRASSSQNPYCGVLCGRNFLNGCGGWI